MKRPTAGRGARRRRRHGFTIVELLIAVMILTAGLLGMASLLASSTRLARLGSSRAEMVTIAEAKLEELRSYGAPGTSAAVRARLAPGGSTGTATASYADSTKGLSGLWYQRRWVIDNAIAGTRRVTLRVEAGSTDRYTVRRGEYSTLMVLQ